MSNQQHSFTGNLTRDPVVRAVNGTKGETNVANFAVAINGRTPEETVYFECEVWGQQADFVVKYFKKGSPVSINDAEARPNNYTNKEGKEITGHKYRVNRISFVPSGGGKTGGGETEEANEEAPVPKAATTKGTAKPKPKTPVAAQEDDDSDIPF